MNLNDISKLSDEIKFRRFKKRKTQEDSAKILNISIPTYRDLENNPNKLNLEQVLQLSEFLEWNMVEFFLNTILQNAIFNSENDS